MKFYERVISDFGGYEKCKDILSQPNIDFIMNAQGLREHMLKYRRQHNIFEVGDKVVYVDDFMPDSVSVVSEVNDRVWLNGNNAVCVKEMVKHANDEEIKAGKRLEVNHG